MTHQSVREDPPFGSVEARYADFRNSHAVVARAFGCIHGVVDSDRPDAERVRLIRNIVAAVDQVQAERAAAALTPDDVPHYGEVTDVALAIDPAPVEQLVRHAEDCPGVDGGPCVCPESVE